MASGERKANAIVKEYWSPSDRNHVSSARLFLQHYLLQNTINYVLDPAIKEAVVASPGARPLKVADLGCGNAAWLFDLHRVLETEGINDAQLDGFDINEGLFPAIGSRPAGVRLQKLDILARPLPEELLGAYDVVHLRLLSSLVIDDELGRVLTLAHALLKPGGWLQWEESQVSRWSVEWVGGGDTPGDMSGCNQILNIIHQVAKASRSTFGWLNDFDGKVREHGGFQQVSLRQHPKRKEDLRAWTDNYLMVWDELTPYFPYKKDALPEAVMTKELWEQLFAKALQETANGVALTQKEILGLTAQKE